MISEAVMASASIPAVFQPTYINDMVLVDGGTFTNLDLADAILKCKEVVDDEKDIIVDIITCFDVPVEIQPWTLEEARFKTAS
jgi:predicted acylesterase/phospholipase RssA